MFKRCFAAGSSARLLHPRCSAQAGLRLCLLCTAPRPANRALHIRARAPSTSPLSVDMHCSALLASVLSLPLYSSLVANAGTGGKPELGEEAAQESHQEIGTAVQGADMVRGVHTRVQAP